jgi:hypothetical protein
MTFKTQIAEDMAVFYNSDEFADTAVYSPVTGADVTTEVIVDHDVLIQADGYDASVATLGTTVTAMVADVGTVVRGDTFAVGSTTYTVQRIERYSDDGREVTVVVK